MLDLDLGPSGSGTDSTPVMGLGPGISFSSSPLILTISRVGTLTLILAKVNCSFIFQVTYALLALVRAYQIKALEWAKESVSLIPKTAVTEIESSRFLQALSDSAAGASMHAVMVPIEELSDVCRRNRTVQEIVQDALKPLELNMVQRV